MPVVTFTGTVSSREHVAPVMKEKLLELFGDLPRTTDKSGLDSIIRIRVDLPSTSPANWLMRQNATPRLYWSDRNRDLSVAGVSETDSVSLSGGENYRALFKSMSDRLSGSDKSARYFGGMSFGFKENQSSNTESWKSFGRCRFVLPRFEMIGRDSGAGFVCNIIPSQDINRLDSIVRQLDALDFDYDEYPPGPLPNTRTDDDPGRDAWKRMISSALEMLESDPLEKVVLARKTELRFTEGPDPAHIMSLLQTRAIGCFHFLFQFCSDSRCHAFLGASPELLYRRQGSSIKTEAVAGTRPRGKDSEQDRHLEQELLHCDKDIREHHFVVRSISGALKQLCETFGNGEETGLMKLARLQHLMKRYEGKLRPGMSDADIMSRLHPTPAVGGYPTEEAISIISELEPFDRGWYAGPVGWLSADGAEFAVAIRSGLLDGDRLSLYSGAGIIQGSLPEQEWDEVESKISNFIAALEG